jgi:hypothetical protein
VRPFNYEPPKLVDFRQGRTAHGDCTSGSGNSSTCGTGHGAGCCNTGSGGTLYACCDYGGCAIYGQGYQCVGGCGPIPSVGGSGYGLDYCGGGSYVGCGTGVCVGIGGFCNPTGNSGVYSCP